MITVIKGNLGSGKSYFAVKYLTRFVKYDKLYEILDLDYNVLLVTNLDDIKVNHITWVEFFNQGLTNQDKLKEFVYKNGYKKIIIIIDESQKYFSGIKDPELFFFFEYSRHYGMDIFLICQSLYGLPKRLVELSEYVVDARQRSQSITGFQYVLRDSVTGEKISTKFLKKDKEVFRLYKSFNIDEDKKAKPVKIIMRQLVLTVFVFSLLAGIGVYYMKHGFHLYAPKYADKQMNEKAQLDLKKTSDKKPLTDKLFKKTDDLKNEIKQDYQEFKNELGTNQKLVKIQDNITKKTDFKISGVAHVGEDTYIIYR
jgi:hypothetical protein